jgi:RHS repeat-associated protein
LQGDNNKSNTSESITGTMSGYGFNSTTYDDEDRLTGWNRADNALTKSWNLSLVGDWNSVTENSTTQSRTHGPTHELLTAAGQNVTTDTKGNMTVIPAVLRPGTDPLALTWDQDNRLSAADVDNDSTYDITYQYDALGRRVARDDGTNTTVFVQSGQQTIADYISGTAPTTPVYTYYYASYIDEPIYRTGTGASRYFHKNQQFSVIALTDSGGNVTERFAYTAYGTPTITDGAGATLTTSADNNRYMYTGREWDEVLGLYHYRARMYDGISGRFLSRDPAGYEDGLNLVGSYFTIRQTDPSGLGIKTWCKKRALCITLIAVVAAPAATCGIACSEGHWDVHGEGYATCMKKCINAGIPDEYIVLVQANALACGLQWVANNPQFFGGKPPANPNQAPQGPARGGGGRGDL